MKQSNGLRKRNKFPCNFCSKRVSEYARHLSTVHKAEKQVAKILLKPKKQRRQEFAALRLRAVSKYNVSVLKGNVEGELVVSRRSSKKKPDDFLPCPKCHSFMVSRHLWRHFKTCPNKPGSKNSMDCSNGRRANVVKQARQLLEENIEPERCKDFSSNVLCLLRKDLIAKVAKRDKIIILFGKSLYKRLGNYRATEVCQRMRLLARLLIQINDGRSDKLTLIDCIDGKHFDTVVEAAEKLCGEMTHLTGRRVFVKPSVGLKLGHSVLKCARLKKREAIKADSKKLEHQADRFISLYQSDWMDVVSSKALMTLKLKRLNGPEMLPLTEDLLKLNKYLDDKITAALKRLSRKADYTTWRQLLECTLVAIVIFNKRRGGEASKLLMDSYVNRPNWRDVTNQEILSSLTDMEKTLLNRFGLF